MNPSSHREGDATILFIFRSTGSLNDYASKHSLGNDYNNNVSCCCSIGMCLIFRLDALAWSVIATATWLGGWLSHSGIISKPLN